MYMHMHADVYIYIQKYVSEWSTGREVGTSFEKSSKQALQNTRRLSSICYTFRCFWLRVANPSILFHDYQEALSDENVDVVGSQRKCTLKRVRKIRK